MMTLMVSSSRFLSTPSARRATLSFMLIIRCKMYFYPRPPRGGRPVARTLVDYTMRDFYPRPPRGGRPKAGWLTLFPVGFLSTPSARRATAGSWYCRSSEGYFYPRPPRGGRHAGPARLIDLLGISIHALREEGDEPTTGRTIFQRYFYPRPPRGGRRDPLELFQLNRYFYPRPPRGGRQQKQRQNLYFQTNCTTFCTNLEEP